MVQVLPSPARLCCGEFVEVAMRNHFMGAYSVGAFTLVDFFHQDGHLRLAYSREPDGAGVSLHRIGNGEHPRSAWIVL